MSKPTAQKGEFCWNELMTPNLKKAKEFYQSLFGWESQDHDMGDAIYTMVKKGDNDVGGMMQIPKDKEAHMPPHWMSYVFVENVDETLKKAKSLGAVITVDATPVADFGRFGIIQDPTGAHIAVWQSMKGC